MKMLAPHHIRTGTVALLPKRRGFAGERPLPAHCPRQEEEVPHGPVGPACSGAAMPSTRTGLGSRGVRRAGDPELLAYGDAAPDPFGVLAAVEDFLKGSNLSPMACASSASSSTVSIDRTRGVAATRAS